MTELCFARKRGINIVGQTRSNPDTTESILLPRTVLRLSQAAGAEWRKLHQGHSQAALKICLCSLQHILVVICNVWTLLESVLKPYSSWSLEIASPRLLLSITLVTWRWNNETRLKLMSVLQTVLWEVCLSVLNVSNGAGCLHLFLLLLQLPWACSPGCAPCPGSRSQVPPCGELERQFLSLIAVISARAPFVTWRIFSAGDLHLLNNSATFLGFLSVLQNI